jgi:hypothetical protein
MIKGQGEFDDTKGIVSSHKYEERIQWLKKKIKGQGEFDDTKGIIPFIFFPLAIVFFLQIYDC